MSWSLRCACGSRTDAPSCGHNSSAARYNRRLSSGRSACTKGAAAVFVRCQAESGKNAGKGKARSARERLQANPAYQRLKEKASWKDLYRPAEIGKPPPGEVPKHLLEGGSGGNSRPETRPTGSITRQLQAEQRAEPEAQQREIKQQQQQQPQASTSGRANDGQAQTAPAQSQGLQSSHSYTPARAGSQSPSSLISQQQRNVRMSRIRFWIQFHAQFGQRMRIVGSHENLGTWKLSKGVELQWSPNDMWNAIVELPAGAIVEYKYVLLENDGTRAIAWQQGNNSVLAVGHSDDDVEVFDNWEASPGASVVAAGGTTTREGRLLSWASEIESLFSSQRSELRKSRMELVAAQDEARLAREEARQFRAELRASEAERVKAEMKAKELSVANRLLRSQLSDTTLSFRNALETTHQFLLEAEQAMMSQKGERRPVPERQGNSRTPSEISSRVSEEKDPLEDSNQIATAESPLRKDSTNGDQGAAPLAATSNGVVNTSSGAIGDELSAAAPSNGAASPAPTKGPARNATSPKRQRRSASGGSAPVKRSAVVDAPVKRRGRPRKAAAVNSAALKGTGVSERLPESLTSPVELPADSRGRRAPRSVKAAAFPTGAAPSTVNLDQRNS